MADYAIGLDLGGTNLRAAAIGRDGKMLEKVAGSTNLSEGREAVLADIVNSILLLRANWGAPSLAGIGVAAAGYIRLAEGVITNSNNMPFLENFPFRAEIERRLGTHVILENDANAAALGEKWMGAGRDYDELVLLTLGTGIGGGIISRGRVLRGFLGMAGEVGHMTVVPNGNPCGCGNQGCLEKHASATAVAAMARVMNLGENLTSKQVYDMAQAGDERARRIFLIVGQTLGIGLATLVNVFNFPIYLLSGGMLAAWDLFAPPMLEEMRRRSFSFRTTHTRVEKATLGNEAGLYGAAYLPWVEEPAHALAGTAPVPRPLSPVPSSET